MFKIIGDFCAAIAMVVTGVTLFLGALTYGAIKVFAWIGGMFWSGVRTEYHRKKISGPNSGA